GQMRFMRRLFELRPWYRSVPDQSVLASDPGTGPLRVVASRARFGEFVIAYAPEGKPLSIHMDKVSGNTVEARWYDPREGTWTSIGAFPNTGRREFVPPSQGEKRDWALVLEDAAKGLPVASNQADASGASGNPR